MAQAWDKIPAETFMITLDIVLKRDDSDSLRIHEAVQRTRDAFVVSVDCACSSVLQIVYRAMQVCMLAAWQHT